jgi:DNA-binding XRE family transcriptional regulator
VNQREVLRCPWCKLNQFMTSSKHCRKCRKALVPNLDPVPVAIEPVEPVDVPLQWAVSEHKAAPHFSELFRVLRMAQGLSQSELAAKMGCPRTYISKIETRKITPIIASFLKIADALGVTPQALVYMAEVATYGV